MHVFDASAVAQLTVRGALESVFLIVGLVDPIVMCLCFSDLGI